MFDFDGTLVPSNAIKRDSFSEVVSDLPDAGAHIEAILAAEPTADRSAVFRRLGERVALRCKTEALVARYSELCETKIIALLADGRTAKLLDRLRANGLDLHVSSGTPLTALVSSLERGGIADRFAGIHGHPARKPDTLRKILSSTGMAPESIVVVGDGESDRAAAEETGCRFVPVAGDAKELYGNGPDAGYAFLDNALALTVGPRAARSLTP